MLIVYFFCKDNLRNWISEKRGLILVDWRKNNFLIWNLFFGKFIIYNLVFFIILKVYVFKWFFLNDF